MSEPLLKNPTRDGQCRGTGRHSIKRVEGPLILEGRAVLVQYKCQSCTLDLTLEIDRDTGESKARPKYPENYLLVGVGKKRPKRAAFRLEYVKFLLRTEEFERRPAKKKVARKGKEVSRG